MRGQILSGIKPSSKKVVHVIDSQPESAPKPDMDRVSLFSQTAETTMPTTINSPEDVAEPVMLSDPESLAETRPPLQSNPYGSFPAEGFPSPVDTYSDDDKPPVGETEDYGSDFSTGRRDSPPLVPFAYPPLPPLRSRDPFWLATMLTDLERQRMNIMSELEEVKVDAQAALSNILIVQRELDDECEKVQEVIGVLAKIAGPEFVSEMVREAQALAEDERQAGESEDGDEDASEDNIKYDYGKGGDERCAGEDANDANGGNSKSETRSGLREGTEEETGHEKDGDGTSNPTDEKGHKQEEQSVDSRFSQVDICLTFSEGNSPALPMASRDPPSDRAEALQVSLKGLFSVFP